MRVSRGAGGPAIVWFIAGGKEAAPISSSPKKEEPDNQSDERGYHAENEHFQETLAE
ncbi:MAG: hypothetical protein KGZ25_03985 [Planctomycetes bacterium]|nr:hypothetical protein [Planctomycetota bacterium]